MEKLYVYALLLQAGLYSKERYCDYLNKLFLQNNNNDLLLMLEWCSNDPDKAVETIERCLLTNTIHVDFDYFGRFLFWNLKNIYYANTFSINEFGKKIYLLWGRLPAEVYQKEPFYILCYADDCLSWGDEKQTRELYEKAFFL